MGLLTKIAVLLGLVTPVTPVLNTEAVEEEKVKPIEPSKVKSSLDELKISAGNRGVTIHDSDNSDVIIRYREQGSVAQFHYVEVKQRSRIDIVGWPLLEVINRAPSTVYLCIQFPEEGFSRLHFERQIYWMGTDDALVPNFENFKDKVLSIRFWTWGDGIVYAIVESEKS